jgi:hypothetical protein
VHDLNEKLLGKILEGERRLCIPTPTPTPHAKPGMVQFSSFPIMQRRLSPGFLSFFENWTVDETLSTQKKGEKNGFSVPWYLKIFKTTLTEKPRVAVHI